ncbi:hypothetical protein CERSUDRAFT_75997 [Gelatoporia subvermispora B]|uniref:Uncharacterized protein n=1 Tax=Ceriporiopsis subvermispora (strain B) TaxID=914234 RepID=M2QBX4_CERS8|nr:hypothetical protein CERSUDRAFT_75997 [Gelatoporia subvermispora B]
MNGGRNGIVVLMIAELKVDLTYLRGWSATYACTVMKRNGVEPVIDPSVGTGKLKGAMGGAVPFFMCEGDVGAVGEELMWLLLVEGWPYQVVGDVERAKFSVRSEVLHGSQAAPVNRSSLGEKSVNGSVDVVGAFFNGYAGGPRKDRSRGERLKVGHHSDQMGSERSARLSEKSSSSEIEKSLEGSQSVVVGTQQ